MNSGLMAYRQNSVETATPGQLVVMLYNGVLTALDKAEAALEGRPDIELAHEEFTRAQAIIMELLATLDMSAGAVAHSLASLYEYSHTQLVKANVNKKFSHAEPVHTIFADLRDAWVEITGSDPV
jgi:flagellar secretion chaperone FliS